MSRHKPLVLPEGPDHAFVGPQPAPYYVLLSEGDRYGPQSPFDGEVGRLLARSLRRARIDPAQCRVGYAIWRVLGREPRVADARACQERVIADLQATSPRAIIACGDLAAYLLLGRRGVLALRGAEHASAHGPVLVTFHPAVALPQRAPQYQRWIVEDLRRARTVVEGEVLTAAPTVHVVERPGDVPVGGEVVAFDVETTGLDPLDASAQVLGVGIALSPDEGWYILPSAFEGLPRVFASARRAIAHNAPFDVRWLRRLGVSVTPTWDTMLAEYVLDDTRLTYRLELLAVERLEVAPYHAETDDLLSQGRGADVPVEALAARCVRDACYTLAIYRQQRAEVLRDAGLVRVMKYLMMPSVRVVTGLMDTGLRLDLPLLEQRQRDTRQRQEDLLRRLQDLAGDSAFNPRSPVQVARVLTERLGMPAKRYTPTGRTATNEEALSLYPGVPFVEALREYRHLQKIQASYYDRWLAQHRDGRLYGRFWIGRSDEGGKMRGTATGRWSGDLQQVPRQTEATPPLERVKDVVIASDGMSLLEVDLSQIELRVAAWIAEERAMLRAFREGRDLHRETAMKVLGVSRPTPEQRSTAKAINFGLLYGMGAERFVVYARMEYGLTLSVEEAEEIRAAFFRAYPGLRAYYRRCMDEARRTGAIRTPFGRIRHLPGVGFPEQAGTVYTTAINTPIQATASDLNTLVLLAWRPRVAERGGRLLLPVHDSTLWEVPKGTESAIGGAICSWIRNELVGEVQRKFGVTITCPLDAEAKAGQRWGAMTPLDDRAQSR